MQVNASFKYFPFFFHPKYWKIFFSNKILNKEDRCEKKNRKEKPLIATLQEK